MRNTGGIQSLLQVGILHFLGVAEGLHEQHQTLCAALLDLGNNILGTAVLVGELVVQQDIVVHGRELQSQSQQAVIHIFGSVEAEAAAFVSHIVSCDGNVVVDKDLQQLGVVADDTAGNNLGAVPLCSGQSLQLFVQSNQLFGVLVLQHEVACLQHGRTLDGVHHIAVLVCQLHELAAGSTACVVNLDGVQNVLVGHIVAGQECQLVQHAAVLVLAELNAPIGETVLGMCQEDAGDLSTNSNTEVLAHGAQSIADGGGDQSIQLIHGAVQQHFQSQLCNVAVEGCAVFLAAHNFLVVAAPDAHGHHTGSVNQLFGSVVGQNAYNLFALSLKLLQLLSRVDGSEFLNSCFNAHRISPPYSWRFQP